MEGMSNAAGFGAWYAKRRASQLAEADAKMTAIQERIQAELATMDPSRVAAVEQYLRDH